MTIAMRNSIRSNEHGEVVGKRFGQGGGGEEREERKSFIDILSI